MDSQAPGGHTRRSFVARSGVLAAAAWLAATGWDKTLGRAVAALSPSLEDRHRRTYITLVDAVSASDKNGMSAESVVEAGGRFDTWYSLQPSHTQRVVDCVLDDLDAAFGKPFHKAGRNERLEFVQERTHGPYGDRPLWHGSGEAKAGRHRVEQIRRTSQDPDYQPDPADFSTAKSVPSDRTGPSTPSPRHTETDVHRRALMDAALTLVAAPFSPTAASTNPEDLTKVHLVPV